MAELLSSAYEMLGLEEGASTDEIRSAYMKLALEWHPDKHLELATKEEMLDMLTQLVSRSRDNDNSRSVRPSYTDMGITKVQSEIADLSEDAYKPDQEDTLSETIQQAKTDVRNPSQPQQQHVQQQASQQQKKLYKPPTITNGVRNPSQPQQQHVQQQASQQQKKLYKPPTITNGVRNPSQPQQQHVQQQASQQQKKLYKPPTITNGASRECRKDRDCYFWKTSGCSYGNKCHFRHHPALKGRMKRSQGDFEGKSADRWR